MNEYKISYTLYPMHGKHHFSHCRSTIKGHNFAEAVSTFSKEQRDRGFVVRGVVEGDLFEITFYDLNTGEVIDKLE